MFSWSEDDSLRYVMVPFSMELENEPRPVHTLGKCSTTHLHRKSFYYCVLGQDLDKVTRLTLLLLCIPRGLEFTM